MNSAAALSEAQELTAKIIQIILVGKEIKAFTDKNPS
jgi:hypothetical protein